MPLYEVLCFDLDEQISSFDSLVSNEALKGVRGRFQRNYFDLQDQDDGNPGKLLGCLNSLTCDCLRLLSGGEHTCSEVETAKEKLIRDTRNAAAIHIMKTLNCRVKLLTKFLADSGGRAVLLDQPLSCIGDVRSWKALIRLLAPSPGWQPFCNSPLMRLARPTPRLQRRLTFLRRKGLYQWIFTCCPRYGT